jgi:hypothetical protein
MDGLSREIKRRWSIGSIIQEFVARRVQREPAFTLVAIAATISIGVMLYTRDDRLLTLEEDEEQGEDGTSRQQSNASMSGDEEKASASGSDWGAGEMDGDGTDTTALYGDSDEEDGPDARESGYRQERRPSNGNWGFYVDFEDTDVDDSCCLFRTAVDVGYEAPVQKRRVSPAPT